MPELSERTLEKVILALGEMVPDYADTFPLIRDFWRTKLFRAGLPDWFIQLVIKRSMNWSVVIPELFASVRVGLHIRAYAAEHVVGCLFVCIGFRFVNLFGVDN